MTWPLEAEARADRGHADSVRASPPREDEIELSKAISLKRIADALDGTALGVDVSESLAALGHAYIHGRQG